jgi:hypothetical protein
MEECENIYVQLRKFLLLMVINSHKISVTLTIPKFTQDKCYSYIPKFTQDKCYATYIYKT